MGVMRRLALLFPILLAACGGGGTPGEDRNQALPMDNFSIETNSADSFQGPPLAKLTDSEPAWFYRDDPGGGLALYGKAGVQGQFAIRCDRRGRQLLFQRAAEAAEAAELTLAVDGQTAQYPARSRTQGTHRLEASAKLDDPIVDRLLHASAINVSATGTEAVTLPGDPVVRRLIEACRAPAAMAAVADGARFQGSLPCPDCDGIDVTLSFSAKAPETERYTLVRRYRGREQTDTEEGMVEMLGGSDPPLYRLTPDDGSQPVYLARITPDRFLFRTPDNQPDPDLADHPIVRVP